MAGISVPYYYPFCAQPSGSFTPDAYPSDVWAPANIYGGAYLLCTDKDQAFKWVWKLQEATVAINVTIPPPNPGDPTITVNISGTMQNLLFNDNSVITSESQKTCQNYLGFSDSTYDPDAPMDGQYVFSVESADSPDGTWINYPTDSPKVTRSGRLQSPVRTDLSDWYLEFVLELQVYSSVAGGLISYFSGIGSGLNSTSFLPETGLTNTFDSLSFTIYSLGGDSGITGTMDVSPSLWWPCDPGDGSGPIWDSTDGSQLRSPFSVQTWN